MEMGYFDYGVTCKDLCYEVYNKQLENTLSDLKAVFLKEIN